MAETSPSTSSKSGSSAAAAPILNLSQDHIFTILLLLPVDSILSFCMTCKRFSSLTSSDSLWESICRREWGPTSVDALKLSSSVGGSNQQQLPWMRMYKQVAQLDSVACYKLPELDPDGLLELPSPRASHSLNFVSDCLVMFGGGCDGVAISSSCNKKWKWNSRAADKLNGEGNSPCANFVVRLETYGGDWSDHAFASLVGRHLDDTWVAYIGNDVQRKLKWKKIQSGVPSGRFGHTCVVIGDYLVLFGGINDTGIRHNDTWVGQLVFNESLGITFSWRLLNVGSIVPPPRGAHAACCIDKRKMIMHGGIGLSGLRLGDTWVLEVSENLLFGRWWELVTRPSPPPRSGHSLTCIGSTKVVLFGGRGLGYEVMDDVWLLQTAQAELKWVQVGYELQNVPDGVSLPRVGHSANVILGGRLLIYGGEDSYRHRKDDFWLLDISGIPSAEAWPIALILKGSRADIWKRLKANGYRPSCRSFHRACADRSGRYLFVFGGMVDDGVLHTSEAAGLGFDGELFLLELFN